MTMNDISANTSPRHRAALCLALGAACLAVARPSPAQQATALHPHIGWSPTRGQVTVSGANPTPRTPEMQAQIDRIESLNHAAAVALHAGDYATAEADARASMAVGQDSGVAEELLAQSLEFQGREQEAYLAYKRMVDARDDAPRDLLPYALLSLKAGNWTQALAAYQKALRGLGLQESPVMPHMDLAFSPDDPQPTMLAAAIHVARGLTYNGGCDWAYNSQDDKALAEYQKALALDPNWDLANYYYGYGLQHLGRTAQASAAFQKTLKIAHGGVKLAAVQALKKLKVKPA